MKLLNIFILNKNDTLSACKYLENEYYLQLWRHIFLFENIKSACLRVYVPRNGTFHISQEKCVSLKQGTGETREVNAVKIRINDSSNARNFRESNRVKIE